MKYLIILIFIISCTPNKTEVVENKNDSLITYTFNKFTVNKAKLDMQNSFKKSKNDIIFLGDSKTEGFPLQETFNNLNIKNRGISGNTTLDILNRLKYITEGKPKKIFLEIGVNDFGQNKRVEVVFNNIIKICEQIKEESPDTILYLQSVLPTNSESSKLNEKINVYNKLLVSYCNLKGLTYINLNPEFLDRNELNKKYSIDGIHINFLGYQVWSSILKQYL